MQRIHRLNDVYSAPASSNRSPSSAFVDSSYIKEFLKTCSARLMAGEILDEAVDIAKHWPLHQDAGHLSFFRILHAVRRDIRAGLPLSQAMARRPHVFPARVIAYARAGEVGGCLAQTLNEAAAQLQVQETIDLLMRFLAASIVAYGFVIAGFLLFVIPQFNDIFAGMMVEIPLPTQMLMNASIILVDWWFILIPLLTKGFVVLYRGRHHPFVVRTRQWCGDWIPYLNRIMQQGAWARMARVLVLLLRCGVPIVTAVKVAAACSGYTRLERAAQRIQRRIADGMCLSKALAEAQVLPAFAIETRLRCAEEEGILLEVLEDFGFNCERPMHRFLDFLHKVMAPMVIIILGLLIGSITFLVFVPLLGPTPSLLMVFD